MAFGVLKDIDKIANKFGCYSSALISINIYIENKNVHSYDSHCSFVKNLNTLLLEKQCFSAPQELALIDNVVKD